MLSTLQAVHELRAWVPCSLLSLSMVPFATVSLGIGALSWVVPKPIFVKMDNTLYQAYMRLCLFVFENIAGMKVSLCGDIKELKDNKERAVVISNHQSNVDWAIITLLAARHNQPDGNEQGFRVMVKHAIHYVPLFGWYIFQHGYIYVRRFGEFISFPVLRQLVWLDSLPDSYWLLIFPEGTRYTREKPRLIADSQEFCRQKGYVELKNVLTPKSGGLQLAIDNLRSLEAIYDVTIAYGQTRLPSRAGIAPEMFEYVCGTQERHLHLHVRRHPIDQVPQDREELRKWLVERYQIKDKLMEQFYETGQFPEVVIEQETPISLYRSLPPTLFFVTALILPFFSKKVRTAYICTIASFPLLIGWLKIRKCV